MNYAVKNRWSWLLVTLGMVCFGFAVWAAEQQTEKIDPKVKEIAAQFAEYMEKAKTFSTDVDHVMVVEAQGMKQELKTEQSFTVERPNKVALVLESGMLGGTLVSDGKKLYRFMPMLKAFTVEDAPENLNEVTSFSLDAGPSGMMGGINAAFVEFLMRDDIDSFLGENISEAEYLGEEEIGETKTHHFKLVRDDIDVEFWIEADETPLLVKVIPNMKKALEKASGMMPEMLKNIKMDIAIHFENWSLNQELPGSTFVFNPPADAREVDSFEEAIADLRQNQTNRPTESNLLGKTAPGFKLELLGGGQFDLNEHKGKEIVILDFFASWCGPCRALMPRLEKLVDEYTGKGVKLIAVNLEEDPQTIQKFLDQVKIHPTVALDKEGRIGQLYGANAIPQTVIIDKDGVIQAVHVGIIPNFETTVKNELDTLISGKKLVD